MMFSCPSPGPIDFWTGSLGGLSPLPLALLPPLSLLLPHAAMQATTAAHRPFVLMLPPDLLLGDPLRPRTSVPDATRRAPSARDPRGRPRTSSRGSAGRPEALHPHRARRRSG